MCCKIVRIIHFESPNHQRHEFKILLHNCIEILARKICDEKICQKLCSNCEWNKTENIILPNIELKKSSSTMDRLHLFENATVKF